MNYDETTVGNFVEYESTKTATGFGFTLKKSKIHNLLNDFKAKLLANFTTRFEYVNSKKMLMAATLLDPRYKELPFEEYEEFMESGALKTASKYIVQEAINLINKGKIVTNDETSPAPKPSIATTKKVSRIEISFLKYEFSIQL